MNKIGRLLFIACTFVIILASCAGPVTNDQGKTGDLSLSILSAAGAKTIKPSDADMTISAYVFSGSGPSGATIAATSQASSSFSAASIAAGAWSMLVQGKNAAGTVVASVTTSITVPAGGTGSATAQLVPLAGTGTLSVTVTWPAAVSVDSVTGTLTPVGGSPSTITMAISGSQATYTATDPAGSYLLVVNLAKSGQPVAPPRVEMVLLYSSIVSSGPIPFTAADFAGGGSVATPSLSVAAGTYNNVQILTMSTSTAGASIRYTLDGSIPTGAVGTLYTGAVSISTSQTVTAIAYLTNWTNSTLASAAYVIASAAPAFSVATGTYNNIQSLVLSTSTTGAAIHYTIDGTTPTSTTGTLYSGPISLAATQSVKAIASLSGFADSSVTSAAYVLVCAAPAFSVAAGTYAVGQTLTLTTTTTGASIRFTTDGSTPTGTTGSVYSSPISIAASQTINAIACYGSFANSSVSSAAYVITGIVGAPTFSVAAGTYTSAQSLTLASSTPGAAIRYTIDGSTPSSTVGTVYTTAIAVAASQTVTAIAYYSGWPNSSVASAVYVINGGMGLQVTAPPNITVALVGVSPIWYTVPAPQMTVSSTVSSPVTSYAWYLDGSAIAGATASSVTLSGGTVQVGPHSLALVATSGSTGFSTAGTFSVSLSAIQMVSIPAGSFSNGTSTVTLSAFKMAKYDVTQSQYQSVMGTNPSSYSANSDAATCPVEMVTWYDAVEFCNKQSTKDGLTPVYTISGRTPASGYPITSATVSATVGNTGYRLPTEAQWEYAARAGTTTSNYWGNAADDATVSQYAWYTYNSGSKTHAVGQKLPNSFGLYDMAGNVMQWCWDWYGTYPSGAQTDPTGLSSGTYRVNRGGSWSYSSDILTSASRGSGLPNYQYISIGFRVCAP